MRDARPVGYLEAVPRVRDLLDGERDCYFTGRSWLAFFIRTEVSGLVMWGTTRPEDIPALREALPMSDSPLTERLPRYVDLRRVEGAETEAVRQFGEWFSANATRLANIVSRAAIVHDVGLGLALAAGFSKLAPPPYELRLFERPDQALEWLGCRASTRLAAELETIQATAAGTTPLVRDIRAYCKSKLRTAELVAAAATLGLSPRSLQRKLREHDTSFQNELNTARVEAAKIMLAQTDLPIAEVAASVGSSSVQLGAVFRRAIGQTPRQWRAAHRPPRR